MISRAAPPSTRSVLVIAQPVVGTMPEITPARVIGGLPLLRRIVLAAAAAGYAPVTLPAFEPTGPDADGDGSAPALARVVVLPANVVPQQSWLAAIDKAPLEPETLCIDSSMTIVVTTCDVGVVLDKARRCANVDALAAELRQIFSERPWPFDPNGRFFLRVSEDVARAEAWLLRSLIKQREGFMSRHFERRISLALTRRLAPTRVTPNTMTLVSAAIGLISAAFFLSSQAPWQLAGALLLLVHSILDGCDGELARLKFLQSRRGAVLDFWGDNVVHVAVLVAIAIGWSIADGTQWPLGLGALATAGTLAVAAVMFERTAQDRPMADDSVAARLRDGLANRDFIYALILLSAFGKAAWFLTAVAAGTPIFLLAALWLDRRHGRIP